MTEVALQLEEVSKSYGGFHAVDRLSFRVGPGTIYGFLGPNGAGKTTTLRMILGILEPTSGRITVLGRSGLAEVRDRVGYLPEEKGLYKKMKAWGAIAYFATLKGMSRSAARARAHELLERYGLGAFAGHRTEALSKGMGQKVQLLAAIAHDPELVILDEPFSGLDPVNQQVMEEVIRDLAGRGCTVLFSTHVMQHAERLCERILLLAGGRSVFEGTLAEARRTQPRRVMLETVDDASGLVSVPGVEGLEEVGMNEAVPGVRRWVLRVREQADAQGVLQGALESGLRLRAFEVVDPTLHDVFMNLVGPGAREAQLR